MKRPKFDFHAELSTVLAAERVVLDLDQRKGSTVDNYTRSVGRADKVNAEARHEQTTFLAALAATPHLEFALKYVRAHAKDPRAQLPVRRAGGRQPHGGCVEINE